MGIRSPAFPHIQVVSQHMGRLGSLPASQAAAIADRLRNAKAELVAKLQQHMSGNNTLRAEDVSSIMSDMAPVHSPKRG